MYLFYPQNIDLVQTSAEKSPCTKWPLGKDTSIVTKSMFWGQNKYICGWFEGQLELLDTCKESRCFRTMFYLSTRVPNKVAAVFEVEVKDYAGT